jgi:hypothetical protein
MKLEKWQETPFIYGPTYRPKQKTKKTAMPYDLIQGKR